jgi:uncharacterized protein (TIGR03083 family)
MTEHMVDTAGLFRPLHNELIRLLESLSPRDWVCPTVAGPWRVRDIVAHLIDTDLRRISAQRDGYFGPQPDSPIESYAQLVTFLNELNREWIQAAERLSTQVLLESVRESGRTCAKVLESVDPASPAVYPVAWAGEAESLGWMDVGRDYTEKWHHQQQIRDAVGAPLLLEEKWTGPLFKLSIKALPRAYSDVSAAPGTSVQFVIDGAGGGSWRLTYDGSKWELSEGRSDVAATVVRLSADQTWRLFYNALSADQQSDIEVAGDVRWAKPLLTARSVMV